MGVENFSDKGTPTIILNLTKKKGQKFDSKGEEGKLIGFNFALQSYRIVVPSGRIIESKHVKFLRNPDLLPTTASDCDQLLEFQPPTQSSNSEDDLEIENQLAQEIPPPPVNTGVLRDRLQLKQPIRYGFHHYYKSNMFESAIWCNDLKYWRQAIEKGVNSIESHNVWENYEE
ncbi:hypothetical protein VP01_2216g3 [Puccinia sorghi]|uniref:Retroviral polymerase SH3-like domain-containing protein n=1 Tax=Puccinia sorghi TaxID=27349 RepID=A0A0L6VAN7_9BASI|nr:hypothetical protein VP01_2216g3 [Puccinia sorghi]